NRARLLVDRPVLGEDHELMAVHLCAKPRARCVRDRLRDDLQLLADAIEMVVRTRARLAVPEKRVAARSGLDVVRRRIERNRWFAPDGDAGDLILIETSNGIQARHITGAILESEDRPGGRGTEIAAFGKLDASAI